MRQHSWKLAITCTLLTALGCGGAGLDGPLVDENVLVETAADAEAKADQPDLVFHSIADFPVPSSVGLTETRKLFTTAADFRRYFGVAPPIDMRNHWFVFYSAGRRPTGGYQASFVRVRPSDSGATLKVTTRLDSPGPNCRVTQALSKPTALAYFRKPRVAPWYVAFYRSDTVRDCSELTCRTARCAPGYYCTEVDGVRCLPYDTCATVLCAPGSVCEDRPIVCARAPCPPTAPACVPACDGPQPTAPSSAELAGKFQNPDRREAAGVYPRVYEFASNGSFTISDAVSPCPEGATCVWSGYVNASGTWQVSGSKVLLRYASAPSNGFGIRYVSELAAQKACDGALELVEKHGDGSSRVYRR